MSGGGRRPAGKTPGMCARSARARAYALAALLVAAWGAPFAEEAGAQVERVYHPMYLPADHNWEFHRLYPALSRLFNAFDYGHGVLYETLWTRPDAPPALLEEDIYANLTRRILPDPPRLPMPEASFMPRYARLVPLAKEMFEWAHILHKQSYDILADPRLDEEERDRAMEELLEYYLSSDLAFSDVPKGMEIMDEQYFSQAFRRDYPKFNGLIWAYHWLQVAAYEPLLARGDPDARQAGMNALLVRFWQMLESPPRHLPTEMPMTPAIAPTFTERYPRFAAVFDNLHMMHDVISDILVSDEIPRGEKRTAIYRQADLFRDADAFAVSTEEWIAMALAHGVDAQGGSALGWLPDPPETALNDEHRHHEHHEHGPPERDAAATVRAFHEALARGDSAAVLDLLHPEALIYEQGRAETVEQYRAGHLGADIEFARAVAREVLDERILPGDGQVVYVARTASRGVFRGRDIDSEGVETVVLVPAPDGGWWIRHVHWSNR